MKSNIIAKLIACCLVVTTSFAFAQTPTAALDSMKQAREKLVALLDTADKGTQKVLIAEIMTITAEADKKIDAAISSASESTKPSLEDAKKTWEDFKKTRNDEIIPAVQSGDVAKAKALATGIQKERFKKIVMALQ